MTEALIALGANEAGPWGEPAVAVARAMAALAVFGPVRESRLWRSDAWPPGGPDYVNAAASLRTDLGPQALLAALHAIEAEAGRERRARWGARTLDLDLIAWDDAVRPDAGTWAHWRDLPPEAQATETPDALILPHPRLQDRAFVLGPLADVAPAWRHPVTGRTVAEMWDALPPETRAGAEPRVGPRLANRAPPR